MWLLRDYIRISSIVALTATPMEAYLADDTMVRATAGACDHIVSETLSSCEMKGSKEEQ